MGNHFCDLKKYWNEAKEMIVQKEEEEWNKNGHNIIITTQIILIKGTLMTLQTILLKLELLRSWIISTFLSFISLHWPIRLSR